MGCSPVFVSLAPGDDVADRSLGWALILTCVTAMAALLFWWGWSQSGLLCTSWFLLEGRGAMWPGRWWQLQSAKERTATGCLIRRALWTKINQPEISWWGLRAAAEKERGAYY